MRKELLSIGICLVSLPAFAQEAEGTINTLRLQDGAILGPDSHFILVNGFATAGSCATTNGLVIMRIRGDKSGDRQTAVALMAQATGKKVRVSVDSAFKDSSGSCYLRYINVAE